MIYETLFDDKGNECPNRTMIFITVDKDGNIKTVTNSGKVVGSSCTGLSFVVDDYVADQIDKFELDGRDLKLKKGETLAEPIKSDIDLEEEELRRQLEDIKRRRQEQAQKPNKPENLTTTATDNEIKLDWQSTDNR